MPVNPTPPTTRERPGDLRRVIAASLIGTTIEWYDFFLYTLASATVFAALFFPKSDPLTGTLLAFLTYAVGFVARPLGAVVFGHFGDRLGRKRLLVVSLVLMGTATTLIGCLPTYATLGAAAPLLLTALRVVQGFALGGEWGGAVLLVAERGAAERRGFHASWPQAGGALGFVLAAGALTLLSNLTEPATVLAWAWRLPFLASALLVVVGLWIRLSVEESPLVRAALAEREQQRGQAAPAVEVLRRHWREVLLVVGVRIGENISFYIVSTFVLTYCTAVLKMPQKTALNAVLIASAVELALIPLLGALTDRVGRRPVYLAGAVGMGLWIWPFFRLADSRSFGLLTVATVVGVGFHAAMYAPQAAFVSELFATRVRYSGASIGAQVASIAAGAPAPLIAIALLEEYGSATPIALYVTLAVAVTALTLLAARETRGRDLAAVTPTGGRRRPAPADPARHPA